MTDKILTHLRDVQMLMNAGQLLPAGRSLTAAIAGVEKMIAELSDQSAIADDQFKDAQKAYAERTAATARAALEAAEKVHAESVKPWADKADAARIKEIERDGHWFDRLSAASHEPTKE
jgi:hypothetical protein